MNFVSSNGKNELNPFDKIQNDTTNNYPTLLN